MTVPEAEESVADRVEREKQQLYAAFERIDRGEPVDLEAEFSDVLGVVHRPITWDQLKAALEAGTEEAMGTLGRTVLQIKAYYNYRDTVILQQFASVADYLLQRVFDVPLAVGPDGRKVAVPPAGFGQTLRLVWRDNDFPYYFEEGVEHHNVWATQPLSQEQLQQAIEEHRRGYETLWYINPPPLQSVPTLWHAHVISRRLPGAGNGCGSDSAQAGQQAAAEGEAG